MGMFGFTAAALPSYYKDMCACAEGLVNQGVEYVTNVSGGMLSSLQPRATMIANAQTKEMGGRNA